MGRRVATGWWRGCRGRGVGAGRPPSGHGARTGGRGSRGSGGHGWKPPAAVARGARPRDGGRAKVTQRRADSLAGPARGPRPERPRVRPGRAASVSPRGRAGPSRDGRGRGPRAARAAGRRRRAGPGYLWKETARFSPLPCRLEQFAAAQQITISGLGPPHRRQAPALLSPRRAPGGTAPRGGRAATRLRDVGASPAAPAVRQDGGARPPAARPPGPALGAPWIPGTWRGAAHGSRRLGWAGAPRTGSALWRHGARGASVRQEGRAGGPEGTTGSRSRPGALLPTRACFSCPGGSLVGSPEARRRPPWSRARGPRPPRWVRRTPRWRRRTSVAYFRPRPRPRPFGPDWPRRRPVASLCGTVGATPRSVGGSGGKMDAGEGRRGVGGTGAALTGPLGAGAWAGASPARPGRGAERGPGAERGAGGVRGRPARV